ncbi:hypothetical protein Tco_1561191 [Tanacetum coccineum]
MRRERVVANVLEVGRISAQSRHCQLELSLGCNMACWSWRIRLATGFTPIISTYRGLAMALKFLSPAWGLGWRNRRGASEDGGGEDVKVGGRREEWERGGGRVGRERGGGEAAESRYDMVSRTKSGDDWCTKGWRSGRFVSSGYGLVLAGHIVTSSSGLYSGALAGDHGKVFDTAWGAAIMFVHYCVCLAGERSEGLYTYDRGVQAIGITKPTLSLIIALEIFSEEFFTQLARGVGLEVVELGGDDMEIFWSARDVSVCACGLVLIRAASLTGRSRDLLYIDACLAERCVDKMGTAWRRNSVVLFDLLDEEVLQECYIQLGQANSVRTFWGNAKTGSPISVSRARNRGNRCVAEMLGELLLPRDWVISVLSKQHQESRSNKIRGCGSGGRLVMLRFMFSDADSCYFYFSGSPQSDTICAAKKVGVRWGGQECLERKAEEGSREGRGNAEKGKATKRRERCVAPE